MKRAIYNHPRNQFLLGTLAALIVNSLLTGCTMDLMVDSTQDLKLTEENNLPEQTDGPQQKFTLDFPTTNHRYDYLNYQKAPFRGKCQKDQVFKIMMTAGDSLLGETFHLQKTVTCDNLEWSTELNLETLPDGPISLTIKGTDDTNLVSAQTVNKSKLRPEHLFINTVRSISVARESKVASSPTGQRIAVTYTSDEFCALPNCGVTNVMLRLSSNNYNVQIPVTSNLTVNSVLATPVFLDENTVRIFYLSKEQFPTAFNLAYRDVDIVNNVVGSRVDITSQKLNDISSVTVLKNSKGAQVVTYLSREYCSQNACSVDKPTIRESTDSFASTQFRITNIECGVSLLKTAFRPNTDELYLLGLLTAAGTCTISTSMVANGNIIVVADKGATITQTRFGLTHATSMALGVKNDGEQLVFFHSVWHGGCGNWALYYKSSKDSFNTATLMPQSCPFVVGYAGTEYTPTVISDSDGLLVGFTSNGSTPTTPGTLVVASSVDNFAGTVLSDTAFSDRFLNLALTKTPSNDVMIAGYEIAGSQVGINLFHLNRPRQRTPVSPRLTGLANLTFSPQSGPIVSQLSPKYCKEHSCQTSNWLARFPKTGTILPLTQFTDANLQLGNGYLVEKPNQQLDFFYTSNESNASIMNIETRSSKDSFSTKTSITTDTTYPNYLFNVLVDNAGTTHFAYQYGFDKIGYCKSDNNYLRTTVNASSAWSPTLSILTTNGQSAIFYGGNETGAWKANLRTSADNFGTKHLTLNNNISAYSSRTPAFKSNGDITVVYLGDENADTVRQVTLRSSTDNYATYSEPFTLTNGTVCSYVKLIYDQNDKLYIAYSFKPNDKSFCQVEVRASDDWTKKWIAIQSPTMDYLPSDIFLSSEDGPLACWSSSFELGCTKLNSLVRQ